MATAPIGTLPSSRTSAVWFKAKLSIPVASKELASEAAGGVKASSSSERAPRRDVMGPNQTAWALDLSSMNKGIAWVNGFSPGRYWVADSTGCYDGQCAPPRLAGADLLLSLQRV